MLFDTHAHLDFPQFDGIRENVIDEAVSAGVHLIMSPGIDVASSKRACELTNLYPQVYAAVGIHPHKAKEATDESFAEIERLASLDKVVAIGEIGLDYYRNISPQDVQKEVFHTQLEIAKRLGLPVIVHIRDAFPDAFSILEPFAKELMVLLHSFSGDENALALAMDKGFFISFNGTLTYPGTDRTEIARLATRNKVLLETDSPYLTPHPFRGTLNRPVFVKNVAHQLAAIWRETFSYVEKLTMNNGCSFFGIEKPAVIYPVRPKRSLGQNFLVDENIARKIAKTVQINRNDTVIEIGSGRGMLTRFLCERAGRVIAVEIDRNLANLLCTRDIPNLEIINEDFLNISLSDFGEKLIVAGNIPYNITSSILFKIVSERKFIRRAALMMQKEVADRLVALPGTKNYGLLSVFIQFFFAISRIMNVPPECFIPRPRVTSAVVVFNKKFPVAQLINEEFFIKFVKLSFAKRRKKLINSVALSSDIPSEAVSLAMRELSFPEDIRAESISPEDFSRLANAVYEKISA
ncbi:MAG: ribosomal RNA small subunit methyltransferase A [candidate division Zixibacteria bacterium 4484_93]|nr:MAG: ribosomal RNA small subunit methyltransferase A [candidate division Zixibacteria bacterium 4484_93]